MDTTRNDQNRWRHPLVHSDWSALCHTLHDGVEQEDWEAAMTVGIKKIEAHGLGLEAINLNGYTVKKEINSPYDHRKERKKAH